MNTPPNVGDYVPPYSHEYPKIHPPFAASRPPLSHSTRRPVYFNFPKLERSPTGSGELEPEEEVRESGRVLGTETAGSRSALRSTVAPWSMPRAPFFRGDGGPVFTPPPLPPPPLTFSNSSGLQPPPQNVNRSLDAIPLRTRGATSHQFYHQPYFPPHPHQELYVETAGRPTFFPPLTPSDPHLPHSYRPNPNPYYPHYDLS